MLSHILHKPFMTRGKNARSIKTTAMEANKLLPFCYMENCRETFYSNANFMSKFRNFCDAIRTEIYNKVTKQTDIDQGLIEIARISQRDLNRY